jgi:hypothetical protein
MSALLGPVALPKDVAFLFSPMDDSATCFIDPNARSGALVPCPLISIHAVDMPIQALLESTIGPRLGRKILFWRQQSRIALSKLGAVDRKEPRDDDRGEVEVRKEGRHPKTREGHERGRL